MSFDGESGNSPLYTDIDNSAYTIAVGQSNTSILDLEGLVLLKISIPSNLTGDYLTFKVDSDLTRSNLKQYINSDGTIVKVTVLLDSVMGITPQDFAEVRFLQIVSNTPQTGSDAIFNLTVRRV